jgi:hypothetical protein
MALDPSIILGARPAQFDMAQFSPMNAMTNVMKLKQFDQESELNALRMEEARAVSNERNALRKLDPSAPDYESQLFRVNPQLGINYRKETATTAAQKAAADKSAFDLKAAQRKFGEDLKRGLSANPSDENIIAFGQDAVLQGLYTPEQVDATVKQLLAMPPAQRATVLAQSGASAGELKPSVQQVNQGGQTQMLRVPAFGGAPTSIGTFADVPLPADVQAQNLQRAAASAARNTVQLPPQEKAEQADRGKMLVAEYNDISKAAKLAAKTLPSLDANLNILNKGFTTGFGTETKAAGASVLAALGVANADKFATNAQIFQAKATEAVLQKQLEQKGPQTESDAKRIDAVGAQLGKTTEGNKFLLTTAKEQLKRDMEQRNFYDAWWKKNKTYDGAEDAWFAGEGGKSLFDRPALKQYAGKPQESAAAQIPTAATPARAAPAAGGNLAQERAAAAAAIAAGAPAAAVRARFKQNTGQEF